MPHMPTKLPNKTINFMSLTFVSRASLPQLAKGAVGKESLTVHENGQVILSKKVMDLLALTADTKVVLGFDTASRQLVIQVATPKLIKLVGGDNGCYILKVSSKTKQGFFAASAFLQDPNDEIFGEGQKYDYKASGNQTFDATVNEKDKSVAAVLPVGALKKKPVVARKKKTTETPAPAGTTPAPAKVVKAEEPELEELVA